jgi:hypothetical protein
MLARVAYVAACILVPLAWGLATWAVTRAIEKRRPPRVASGAERKPPMPDLEYYL